MAKKNSKGCNRGKPTQQQLRDQALQALHEHEQPLPRRGQSISGDPISDDSATAEEIKKFMDDHPNTPPVARIVDTAQQTSSNI